MKLFLLKIFTWWNGQTFGTQLWTWRFGELVGEDEQGNRYFRTKGRKIDPSLGFERRWVVYNGYAEATRVPPSWHRQSSPVPRWDWMISCHPANGSSSAGSVSGAGARMT